jgi:hypothetical protein
MAKPKLALIPAAQGTSLYSVLPSSGVGDFDFTRSGSATRINSQGLIETVGSGVSRLNYPMIDGVVKGCPHHILEPQRLQRVRYSEDFSQLSSQSNVTISLNQVISPDGTLNATSFIDNSASGVHRAYAVYSSNIASGQLVSHSIFAKAKEHKWFQLSTGGNTNDQWANFDLENGVIGNSSSSANPIIENYGNGWYRCILFATTSATNASLAGLITLTNNLDATLRSPSYSGSNKGVYVFGLQIEEGSYPTSYIPNYGTAAGVTRSAETANGSGSAATFNSEQGVLMFEARTKDDGTNKFITLSDGSDDNRITIYFYTAINDDIRFQIRSNNINQLITPNPIGYNIDEFNKIAIKYKQNDVSAYINGFLVLSNIGNIDTPLNLSRLAFDDGGGANPFYGSAKQLQYFDTALNSEDLEKLTSWVSFQEMAEAQLYTIE